MANNVKVQYGNTIAVAVFALTVYLVIQATYVSTIHNQRKAAAEAKVYIVTNVVAIKVAVCQVFGKVVTAAQAAQIHMKAALSFMNTATWHFACFHTAHDAIQIIALDQRQFPHAR